MTQSQVQHSEGGRATSEFTYDRFMAAHLLQRFGFVDAGFELTFDNGKEVSLRHRNKPE